MSIRVCVAQYEVPESSKDALGKLKEIANTASQNRVQLLVTPETSIGMLGEVKKGSTNYLQDLKEVALKNNISISTSFYHKERNKYYNLGYCISNKGNILFKHKKIYLAPPEIEDNISQGKTCHVSKGALGRISMLICKDGFNKYSHFLYQHLNDLKAEIICIPTWSLTYKDKLITQEYIKQLFIYGSMISNAYLLVSGNLNKETGSFGSSLIIHPMKGVFQEGSKNKEELLIQDLELKELNNIRKFHNWWQPKKKIHVNKR